MKVIATVLLLLLFILHQDFWLWNDRSLVFGWLPVGLAYHAAYSLVTALVWVFVIKVLWPTRVVDWAEKEPDQ